MIVPGDKPVQFRFNTDVRNRLIDRRANWGHVGLSEVTFRRTYSRTKPDGTSEDWGECVVRVIEGMWTILRTHAKQNRIPWNEERSQRLAAEAAERMFEFKWTPPGRGLWVMGTDFIWDKGGMALNNCAFVSTKDFDPTDPDSVVDPFRFVMDVGMFGVGPGFDTKGAGKVGVQGVQGAYQTIRVADTREGWVDAVATLIRNHMFGGPPVDLDVSLVRPKGTPLRGFGGVASGPLPLQQGFSAITDMLFRARGCDLTSVMITDIMNVMGKIITAGDIRRIAEIGFGEVGDTEFANMKSWSDFPVETGNAPPDELKSHSQEDYDLYAEHMFKPSTGVAQQVAAKYKSYYWAYKFGGWRWASNNSVFAKAGMDYTPYARAVEISGEPGFAWLDLMRSHGRLKDPANHKDYRVAGGNPCLEQSLESFEACNLVENYPSHAEDYWDFQRSLKFSYLYAKTVTLMGTHIEKTNDVMIRNRRIGCSMSGVADAMATVGRTEFLHRWCEDGYTYITKLDKKYSEWLGVRESIKTTSEKPSGTVSLLAGVRGAGCHYPKPTGYRLMRLATGSKVAQVLEEAGYRVEPAVSDPTGTVVAYFPWLVPTGVPTDKDVGLWEQVKMAADMQYWWADNQVSYTATFTQEEADRGEIGRVLTAYDGQLKGISFLKKDDTSYQQMPFTEADRAEVELYARSLKSLRWVEGTHDFAAADKFCDGAACTIGG